ncbi:DEAD/DEAH box helicase [Nocardia miyunensis]|uniref:DEAD/DEAH box helicase n=1 Tax=Nocardia miyunensis TaxID=282684 RepID=UPI0009FF57B0|nr:DEAD/DEAH box helicase [Nocardia miyunensis]
MAHRPSRHRVPRANQDFAASRAPCSKDISISVNSTESVSGAAVTTSFAALGVPSALVGALRDAGIAAPFPIQADTLPDTLAGRDVLGRGKTGSGKTLAFAIPVVARLATDLAGTAGRHRPAGLILAPTRELATQIATALEPLVAAYSMTVTTVFGGVSQNRQVKALAAGADIVVACPGRLEDLMRQGLVNLGNVGITVIDEADHMADLGFLPGVTRILAATPASGQRLLFSATLDNGVDKLVKRFLPDAVLHSVDEAHSPVAAMTHHVFEVSSPAVKKDVVRALASGSGRRILFMRTKHQARKLAKTLTAEGIPAVDLHGNLAQNARDRNLAAFAEGAARVLVATDVAARGVHVDGVELVVHVDPPAEHKAYLHRSGRTARAGSAGDVVTLVLPEQRKDTAALLRKAAITVRPQSVTADSRAVGALVGVIAPVVVPSSATEKASSVGGTSTRTRRSGARTDSPGRKGRNGAEADAPTRNGRGAKAGAAAQSVAGRAGAAGSDSDRTGQRRRVESAQTSGGQAYSADTRPGGPRRRGAKRDAGAPQDRREASNRDVPQGSWAGDGFDSRISGNGSRGTDPAVRRARRETANSDAPQGISGVGEPRSRASDDGAERARTGKSSWRGRDGVADPGGRTDRGAGGREQPSGRDAGEYGARQGVSSGGRADSGRGSRNEGGRGSGDRPVRSAARESYSNTERGDGMGRRRKVSGEDSRGARSENVQSGARHTYSTPTEDARKGGAGRNGRERSGSQHGPSAGADRSGAGAPGRRHRQGARNGS